MEPLLTIEQQFKIILDGLEQSIETDSKDSNNPYSLESIENTLFLQGFRLHQA